MPGSCAAAPGDRGGDRGEVLKLEIAAAQLLGGEPEALLGLLPDEIFEETPTRPMQLPSTSASGTLVVAIQTTSPSFFTTSRSSLSTCWPVAMIMRLSLSISSAMVTGKNLLRDLPSISRAIFTPRKRRWEILSMMKQPLRSVTKT